MDEGQKNWWQKHSLEVVIALCGIILVGAGVFAWKSGTEPKIEVVSGESLGATTDGTARTVMIDVSGAVNKPGVYKLSENSRVDDALTAAGGVTAEADSTWMEKSMNRSAKLVDGQKVYVPRQYEETDIPGVGVKQILPSQPPDETVNINVATQEKLEQLPGIGPATAIKIINGRPYGRIEELKEKKIVSTRVFDQIKDLIGLW